jgi:hypothetical protein
MKTDRKSQVGDDIVYKVVEKRTRWCSNWALFRAATKNSLVSGNRFKEADAWRKKNKEWFPRYLKGTTVKKAPNSVGILAFQSKAAAKTFARDSFDVVFAPAQIIKVKGIGERKQDVYVVSGCGYAPIRIHDAIHPLFREWPWTVEAPSGTVAYDAVEVLE